jgi:transcriptional regulator of acetoin/glycerol metabolism
MEELMIYDALQRHRGNRRRASKELGIDTSTLYRKIRDLKIDTPTTDGRSRTGKGTR